ncbi:MAG: hypothetical protein NTY07_13090 [Bacteroidia bacterium]|nr:hypothetical protein [Bacteroidia bacterium]
MKALKILFILVSFIGLISCGKNDSLGKSDFSVEKSLIEAPEGLVHCNISKVEGSNTGFVNQTVTLDVSCPASSGCDYISKMVSDSRGKIISIRAYGNTSKDSPCTMAAIPIIVKYEFTPDEKGQFILKFVSRDNSVINHMLTIW